MLDLFRDSTVGQVINHLSGGKLLPYEDQKPGFQMPSRHVAGSDSPRDSLSTRVPSRQESPKGTKQLEAGVPAADDSTAALEKKVAEAAAAVPHEFIVDWWGPDDPENPRSVKLVFTFPSFTQTRQ